MDAIVYEIATGVISFWIGFWLAAKYQPIERIIKYFKKK